MAITKETKSALVKTRLVLNSALRNPKVASLAIVHEQIDAVTWLEKEIQADFSIAPEMMRIAMVGEEPNELLAIVDAVREAYVKEILNKESDQYRVRLDKLKALQLDRVEKLKQKRDAMELLAKGFGTLEAKNLELQFEFKLKELHFVENELWKLRSEITKEQVDLSLAQIRMAAINDSQISQVEVDESLLKEPEVAPLLKNKLDLEKQKRMYDFDRPDWKNDSSYVVLGKQLDNISKDVAALRDKLGPKVVEKIKNERRLKLQRNTDDSKLRLESLEVLEKDWWKKLQTMSEKMDKFKIEKVNLEGLREEITLAQGLTKQLETEITKMIVEDEAPPRFDWSQEAIATKDTDGRIKKAGMAGAGVLVVLVFGVALLEFLQRRVTNVDEVARGLQINVVGTLPTMPDRARRNLGASNDPRDVHWQNMLTESIDAARTMLLHIAHGVPPGRHGHERRRR